MTRTSNFDNLSFQDSNLISLSNCFSEVEKDSIISDCENLTYKRIEQERFGHYSHVFNSTDPNLPGGDESYSAVFDMAEDKNNAKSFNKKFESFFIPLIKKLNPGIKFFLMPNVYRINRGCYFRSHTDAYAGEIGYTFFFTKKWKWDYGGILTFVDNGNASCIFPSNGRVLLRNEIERPHHFVSQVPNYVSSEYYLIVGWASSEIKDSNSIRGNYYEF